MIVHPVTKTQSSVKYGAFQIMMVLINLIIKMILMLRSSIKPVLPNFFRFRSSCHRLPHSHPLFRECMADRTIIMVHRMFTVGQRYLLYQSMLAANWLRFQAWFDDKISFAPKFFFASLASSNWKKEKRSFTVFTTNDWREFCCLNKILIHLLEELVLMNVVFVLYIVQQFWKNLTLAARCYVLNRKTCIEQTSHGSILHFWEKNSILLDTIISLLSPFNFWSELILNANLF